jgi:NAD+ synthase (glutamine-hydrolysing)
VRIGLAQIDSVVGDLGGNIAWIAQAARDLGTAGADLVVTPELAVAGYPPKDLLLREGFVARCDRAVLELAAGFKAGPALLVGHPTQWGVPEGRIANAASLLVGGKVVETVHKCLLPNYDVFDERRYFLPGASTRVLEFQGTKLGVHICEDAWFGEPQTSYHLSPEPHRDPVAELARAGAQVLINLSASPFEIDKTERRRRIMAGHAARHGLPFLFVNQVGGHDDLVFDGNSLVLDAHGHLLRQLPAFEESTGCVVDLQALPAAQTRVARPRELDLLDALTLGLGDYMWKSGFTDCVLGLSGGIDSALAAAIAARAIGPAHVHGLALPSRYSSDHSVADAALLAKNLGIDFEVIPIDAMHRAYEATRVIGDDLASQPQGLADQNLQARIRGAMVMVRSNRHGWLALATGNKSELAVGYCTLYGDMAGGFAMLSDLYKRDVYAVSRYINDEAGREIIPESTLTKAPSAELAPNQFDQDTLPPYPVLDAILEGLVEKQRSVASLSGEFPADTVRWVARKLDRNEFKRRQMPPGIKLSERAFGTGRRMPMAAAFEWE